MDKKEQKTVKPIQKPKDTDTNDKKRRGRPPKDVPESEKNKTKYEKYKEYQKNYHKKYFQENKTKYNEAAKIRRKKLQKLLKDNNLSVKDVVIV